MLAGVTSGPPLTVAIVGGGIGGMAAALQLRLQGHRVTVFEQARHLGEIGAGIQLAPNATRVLTRLGLIDALRPLAVEAQASIRRRWEDAGILGDFPLAEEVTRRFGFPYWHVHRADLHAAIVSAVRQPALEVPPVRVRLACPVTGVEQPAGDVAVVRCGDGEVFEADVVIGADGIHSVIRDSICSGERATFSGDVAYRTLIPTESLLADPSVAELVERPTLTIWLGPGRHLVHYFVRGGKYLNVVACVPGDSLTRESWSGVGRVEDLVAAFDGWAEPAVRLVSAATEVNYWGLYDREPLDRWTDGRVALLGDACHAMLPYQAQGAAQALEDGAALAEALRGVDRSGVIEALLGYETRRRGRASAVQGASRDNRRLFHMPDGPEQAERDRKLAQMSGDFDSYEWLWAPPDL